MKKLKTKIYQYAANQLYDMAEDMMFNEKMFNALIAFGYQLDFICTEQGIYLD